MRKNFKILFLYPNEYLVGVVPSNLAILSACLKGAGFSTRLFDCSLYNLSNEGESQDEKRAKLGQVKKTKINDLVKPKSTDVYDDFIKTVDEYKPNIIAVTLIDSTIRFAFSFLEKIKDKNIPTIAGGVGATFSYDKILNSGMIDFVCRGEGEETIVEFCEAMYLNSDVKSIQNICFKNDGGEIVKNKMRKTINLDYLPIPDFSIYDDSRFYRPFMGRVIRTLQVDIDRGCPYTCTYCAAPSIRDGYKKENDSKYYRTKDLDKFFSETKELIKKYNLDFLWISSETLMAVSTEKFKKFAQRYIEEINLPFWSTNRLDKFSEEKTKLLAEMGCQSISVGLEHGSEEIRYQLLDKHISDENILKAIETIKKYKIHPTINNIIGFPDETREDVFKTIDLNRKINKILNGNHNINSFIFIPFSGTKLKEISIEKGYLKDNKDIPFSFLQESILNMPSMSPEEIRGLERTIPLYIYLPEEFFSEIKIAEKDDEKGRKKYEELMEILKNK